MFTQRLAVTYWYERDVRIELQEIALRFNIYSDMNTPALAHCT